MLTILANLQITMFPVYIFERVISMRGCKVGPRLLVQAVRSDLDSYKPRKTHHDPRRSPRG